MTNCQASCAGSCRVIVSSASTRCGSTATRQPGKRQPVSSSLTCRFNTSPHVHVRLPFAMSESLAPFFFLFQVWVTLRSWRLAQLQNERKRNPVLKSRQWGKSTFTNCPTHRTGRRVECAPAILPLLLLCLYCQCLLLGGWIHGAVS